MAVQEEITMTDKKGPCSPGRSLSIDNEPICSLSPMQTPSFFEDDGNKYFSEKASIGPETDQKGGVKAKKFLTTPASNSTPATVAMTPMSEGSWISRGRTPSLKHSDTPTSAFKHFRSIANIMNRSHSPPSAVDTSTTTTSSTVNSLASKSPLLTECERDPSPQQEGRTLFHSHNLREEVQYEENTASLNHSSTDLPQRQPLVRAAQSDGQVARTFSMQDSSERTLRPRKFHDPEKIMTDDSRRSLNSSLQGQRRRRSSVSTQNQTRRHSSNGNSFTLSVVSLEDEVSVSSADENTMDFRASALSPRQNNSNNQGNQRSRRRTKLLSPSNSIDLTASGSFGNNNSSNSSWSTFLMGLSYKRIAKTKVMIWFLCLFGMTSVSMIVLTNHKISKSLDGQNSEYHDHVSIMFQNTMDGNPGDRRQWTKQKLRRQSVVLPSRSLDSQGKDGTKTKNTIPHTESKANPGRKAPVSLNQLAHFQTDEAPKKKKKNKAADTKDNQRGTKHDAHKEEKKKEHLKDKHHGKHNKNKHHKEKKEHKTHHHHHHHHDHSETKDQEEIKDVVLRTEKSIVKDIGISIPPVATPPKMSLMEITFDSVDRYLYAADDTPTLSNGSTNHRVVVLSDFVDQPAAHRDLELFPSPFTDNTQFYPELDSGDDDERIRTMEIREPYVQGECVPMADWQTTFYPSCNGMHELDWSSYKHNNTEEHFTLFGTKGFWRNAWKHDSLTGDGSGDFETVVLKTLKINHRFEDAYFEHNRIDAVVLERLTASPHVIDIFGFCGHSVITEFADGKRVGELADKSKKIPLERLRIARDIATGLADVHGIDGDEVASFVHLDINPANVVSVGGTLKLNDFNIGIPRKMNTTSNTPCGIPTQYPNPQWRSPEEARGENNLTEMVDVFSLGHIFFRLICGHEPWNKLEPEGLPPKEVLNEKVKNGVLPTIPDEIMQSTDPEVVAIRDVMLQCYKYSPDDRPRARAIANQLQSVLDSLESKQVSA